MIIRINGNYIEYLQTICPIYNCVPSSKHIQTIFQMNGVVAAGDSNGYVKFYKISQISEFQTSLDNHSGSPLVIVLVSIIGFLVIIIITGIILYWCKYRSRQLNQIQNLANSATTIVDGDNTSKVGKRRNKNKKSEFKISSEMIQSNLSMKELNQQKQQNTQIEQNQKEDNYNDTDTDNRNEKDNRQIIQNQSIQKGQQFKIQDTQIKERKSIRRKLEPLQKQQQRTKIKEKNNQGQISRHTQ